MQNVSAQEGPLESLGLRFLLRSGHIGKLYYMVTETQDPNNETRCTSSMLILGQSNPGKLIWHGPLLQVYET